MKIKPITVRYILVHPGFHFDEVKGVYISRRFGEKYFPGISTAKIIFKLKDVYGITPEQMGWSAKKLLNRLGVLCIGCLGERGAQFDEHGSLRSEKKSACMLIANFLGVVQHKEIRRLLEFVNYYDLNGHHRERKTLSERHGFMSSTVFDFDVRAAIRTKHRNGHTNEEVMIWALDLVEEFVEREKRKISLSEKIVKDSIKTSVSTLSGASIWLIETEEHDVPSIAFQKGADVVIIRSQNGESVIVKKSHRFDTTQVIKAIRQAEAEKQGWKLEDGQFDDLIGEHSLLVPNWDFNIPTGNLFNTSEKKVVDVVPSCLTNDELILLVSNNIILK